MRTSGEPQNTGNNTGNTPPTGSPPPGSPSPLASGLVYPVLGMLGVLTMTSISVFTVAVLAPAAAPDIGLPETRVGTFTSLIYLLGMVSGAVTGQFVQRYGAIRLCQGVMLLSSLGLVLFAVGTPWAAGLSAIILGLAYGPFNPASAQILWRLSSAAWRPFVFSLKQAGLPLGGVIAGATLPTLAALWGWQVAAVSMSALSLLMIGALQPLRARFDVGLSRRLYVNWRDVFTPVGTVWGDPILRRYTLCAFSFAGAQLCLGSFLVVYLSSALGMSLIDAGAIFAITQVGGFIGRLAWGATAVRLLSPRGTLVLLGIMTAAGSLGLTWFEADPPFMPIAILAALLGSSSFGWNGIVLSEIATHAGAERVARATSGMQTVMFGGITLFPPLFGLIVEFSGSYALGFVLVASLGAFGIFQMLRMPPLPASVE